MTNNKSLQDNNAEESKKAGPSRREILSKYGAYTAPLVVSMLLPQQAYAMFGSTPFSSTATCQAAHTGMQATNMHCDPGRMHVN